LFVSGVFEKNPGHRPQPPSAQSVPEVGNGELKWNTVKEIMRGIYRVFKILFIAFSEIISLLLYCR
jgi:hypothetical protein